MADGLVPAVIVVVLVLVIGVTCYFSWSRKQQARLEAQHTAPVPVGGTARRSTSSTGSRRSGKQRGNKAPSRHGRAAAGPGATGAATLAVADAGAGGAGAADKASDGGRITGRPGKLGVKGSRGSGNRGGGKASRRKASSNAGRGSGGGRRASSAGSSGSRNVGKAGDERYNRVTEILARDNYRLCALLAQHGNSTESDNLATALATVFFAASTKRNAFFLVRWALQVELDLHKDDPSSLFRGTALATRLMKSYLLLVGRKYLRKTLATVVNMTMTQAKQLEVDPSKLDQAQDLAGNQKRLQALVKEFAQVICATSKAVPRKMKEVLMLQYKEAQGCDVDARKTVVDSLFLRFIFPAITNPVTIGLASERVTDDQQRALLLVSKCLQATVYPSFIVKESYMLDVVAAVAPLEKLMHGYLDDIISFDVAYGHSNSQRVTHEEVEAAMSHIYACLHSHTESITVLVEQDYQGAVALDDFVEELVRMEIAPESMPRLQSLIVNTRQKVKSGVYPIADGISLAAPRNK